MEKGEAEDEVVRQHHQLNVRESEQICGNCGNREEPGMLSSPWGHKGSDTT